MVGVEVHGVARVVSGLGNTVARVVSGGKKAHGVAGEPLGQRELEGS